jgi:hypothetical protein
VTKINPKNWNTLDVHFALISGHQKSQEYFFQNGYISNLIPPIQNNIPIAINIAIALIDCPTAATQSVFSVINQLFNSLLKLLTSNNTLILQLFGKLLLRFPIFCENICKPENPNMTQLLRIAFENQSPEIRSSVIDCLEDCLRGSSKNPDLICAVLSTINFQLPKLYEPQLISLLSLASALLCSTSSSRSVFESSTNNENSFLILWLLFDQFSLIIDKSSPLLEAIPIFFSTFVRESTSSSRFLLKNLASKIHSEKRTSLVFFVSLCQTQIQTKTQFPAVLTFCDIFFSKIQAKMFTKI